MANHSRYHDYRYHDDAMPRRSIVPLLTLALITLGTASFGYVSHTIYSSVARDPLESSAHAPIFINTALLR